jgi:predicted nucleotidyltransferase
VVLFGSRARGDARDDSDYDVAVFLKHLVDRWQEVDRIVPLVTDVLSTKTAPLSTSSLIGRAPMKIAPR